MSQAEDRTLHTASSLTRAFQEAGLEAGMHVLIHTSMRSIGGWVCGGAEAVIQALMTVITSEGTIMMPANTGENSDPQYWQHPPVPSEWWQAIRDETPAFDPDTSITRMMGIINENFRRYPNVVRTHHPLASFAVWGKHRDLLAEKQPLEAMFGEESPLARLYDVGGHVFLLGVTHANNTCLHLAEHRAQFSKVMIAESSAMLVNGIRQRVHYTMLDYDDDDFPKIGEAYESQHHPIVFGKVGNATTRLFSVRSMVDFGTWWMNQNRAQAVVPPSSI